MDYSKKLRLGFRRIQLIDVASEQFLFGHRVALGVALQKELTDYGVLCAIMQTLHNYTLTPRYALKVLPYGKEVVEKLRFWHEKEKQLHYDPTPEERQAGISELSKKTGEFSTVDAIAVRMHISHDEALKLPYSTVFMMLLKDMEQSRFERRLNKIHERKWKR